ncbi:hypothetical protein [Rosenbergiella epipactidis]|uniref:hypothetical protein n=1 Tax=Rosenbergiella epipactidis TaxID=1544694 RepID=UPI001F4EFE81|nr:hypothetical protein [Rosenbergiella epipactidis]
MNDSKVEALILAINEQTKAQQAQTKAILALAESNQQLIGLLIDASDVVEDEPNRIQVYLNGQPKEEQITQIRKASSEAAQQGYLHGQRLSGDR